MITRLMRKYAEKKEHQLNYPGLAIMTGAGAGLGALQGVEDLNNAKETYKSNLKTVANSAIQNDTEFTRVNADIAAAMQNRDALIAQANELEHIHNSSPTLRQKNREELLKLLANTPENKREPIQKVLDSTVNDIENLRTAYKNAITSADNELQHLGKYHEHLSAEHTALGKEVNELTARNQYLNSGAAKRRLIGKPAILGGAIGATIPVGIHLWKKYQGK